jgi:hypothetical protein
MLQLFQPRPDYQAAHTFADHLEATLDLAEELELLYLIPSEAERAPGRDVLPALDRTGAFVERIEAIEVAIAARLETARAAALRIAEADERLTTFTKLFRAGTQPLVDLWPELADPGRRIFESGHDPLTFLQARGVVDDRRSTLEGQKFLGTGADFRLLGTVKLGVFIALCDTCLKALDRHYHLYADDADWEAERARTLDILREQRDEAIRVALGAVPAPIEEPVEIIAADAVDEAIELIEALTFADESQLDAPSTSSVAGEPPEERPLALGPETAAGPAPTEIERVAEIPVELTETEAESDGPLDLAADAVVEESTDAEGAYQAPVVARDGEDAPGTRSAFLEPLVAAGRSIASVLARRKLAAARDALARAAAEPAEAWAEGSIAEAPPAMDVVIEAAAPLEPNSIANAAVAAAAEASVDVPKPVPHGLTAVRQRLVDVIAERAGTPPDPSEVPDASAMAASDPAEGTPAPTEDPAEASMPDEEAAASSDRIGPDVDPQSTAARPARRKRRRRAALRKATARERSTNS